MGTESTALSAEDLWGCCEAGLGEQVHVGLCLAQSRQDTRTLLSITPSLWSWQGSQDRGPTQMK